MSARSPDPPSRPSPTGGGAAARALIVFYRSIYLAADTAPVDALAQALAARGVDVAERLRDQPEGHRRRRRRWRSSSPRRRDVILNATAFSARVDDGGGVLDAADAPVLQVVLGRRRRASNGRVSTRGLGAADLAMNVVLPEIDGRIITRAISFKSETRRSERAGVHALIAHAPIDDRVDYVADLACAWARLAPNAAR